MFSLYSLGLVVYNCLIQLASLMGHTKAKKWSKGRKEQAQKLTQVPDWKSSRKIWIHAASYGEFEMAKPILTRLLADPDNRIFVSFFSPSGFENIHFEDDRIFKLYLPLDLKKTQKKLVKQLSPDAVIFIKYEFWFNLLRVLNESNIPYYFSSIHLNRKHYLWNGVFKPFTELLKKAKRLYCHNPESILILKEKGFDNLELLGDTRILKALENKAEAKPLIKWAKPKPIIIYGSIIPSEYPMIVQNLKEFPEYNHILAPHDVAPSDVNTLVKVLPMPSISYQKYRTEPAPIPSNHCLIIDTLGDLKYLYGNAEVAYVGAGFEKGPHNIVEPMIYGIPTIIGPNIEKFPLAGYLRTKDLLSVLSSQQELKSTIEQCIADKDEIGSKIISELEQLQGDLNGLIKELEK